MTTPPATAVRVSCVVVGTVAAAALLAPLLTPFDPITQLDVMLKNAPPSPAHPLGTDSFSRDVLSRLMYGARSSLLVASIATATAVAVGGAWGALSASAGGAARDVMLGIVDVMRSIPRMLLLLAAFAAFGALGTIALGVVLGAIAWPALALLVDTRARAIGALPFREAATALGTPPARIIAKTIMPHLAAPVAAAGGLLLADLLAVEAGLSFIGLGIRPPHASWGGMIQDALPYLRSAPLGVAIPALCIVTVVPSITCLADAGFRHPHDRSAR